MAFSQALEPHGAGLKHTETFLALNLNENAKSEFSRGVVACAEYVLHGLSQTPLGRQAVLNLSLQPFFENVKNLDECKSLDVLTADDIRDELERQRIAAGRPLVQWPNSTFHHLHRPQPDTND